jgi:hypothetical protein
MQWIGAVVDKTAFVELRFISYVECRSLNILNREWMIEMQVSTQHAGPEVAF